MIRQGYLWADLEWREHRALLLEGAELYRLIADNTRDLIHVMDQGGVLLYASPSFRKALGYTEEDILGRQMLSLVHMEDEADVRRMIEDVRRNRTVSPVQARYRNAAGHWGHFECVGSSIPDEHGETRGILVVSRDVADRNALEEQLRQSQKMEAVGRLAGGVAHDFNNLLTAISGYSDILQRTLDTNDPRRQEVQEIKETVVRAAALTRQLLAFSRKQILQPRVLDLNEVVGGMEKMLQRLIGEDVELITVQAQGLKRIKADPGHVEQVVLNLSVNSRDAMPDGGKLTVETANADVIAASLEEGRFPDQAPIPAGSYVVLSVADTGCGMPPGILSHIFEPFFTTKEKDRGTGLGLSTVYNIVKSSGGYVRVRSEQGKGTVFSVYFPSVEDAADPLRPPETEDIGKGSETVLLVEDDQAVRGMAARILGMHGYKVLEAKNGDEALRLFQSAGNSVQILVTDVVMLGMSGPDLAKALAQKRPGMKVLYLSGYTATEMRRRVGSDVASVFLAKPFRPKELVQKIREILDGAPAGASGA